MHTKLSGVIDELKIQKDQKESAQQEQAESQENEGDDGVTKEKRDL